MKLSATDVNSRMMQYPWEIGSEPAGRVGQGEVAGGQNMSILALGHRKGLTCFWVCHFCPLLHKWTLK